MLKHKHMNKNNKYSNNANIYMYFKTFKNTKRMRTNT